MKNYRLVGIMVLLAMASAFVLGQEMQVRGFLISGHMKSQMALWVDLQGELEVGKEIVLESPKGDLRETYTVKQVVETLVLLEEKLRNEYLAGTRLLQ